MSTPVIIHTRDRLAGVVQSVGRRPADIERRWWESLAVFAVFTGGYFWFGYWLVVDMHVVGFETLDRLNRALMVWHNDPPKLSAIGFDYPPLATLLVAPLALSRGLARSLALVPLASAVFAGLTMVAFNTMLRRAQVVFPLRVVVLLALGANPLVVLYAASGARHFIWISLVVTALGALFAWYVTADIRFVMIAGLAFSIAALAGYSSLVWFLLAALMIGGILARLGSDGTEVEGTVVGFAAPTVYVIALWTAFNLLLLHHPFAWITSSSDAASSGGLDSISVVELLRATGELVFWGAPLAIVVLPVLVFTGLARGNAFALWLGVLLAGAILMPAGAVALKLTDSPMLMRNALPILLIAVIGAIWLARSAEGGNTLVTGLLVVGLLVSIPWTFQAMKTYRYQNLESSFAAAVSSRESQEGAETLNGETIGFISEQAMADYIVNNVTRTNSILTDNAQTYGVMLLTGRPDLFFDRVDQSDGPWKKAATDPARYVDYMLLSTNTSADLLSRLYPGAATGSDGLLPVVYRTERYVLVQIPPGYTFGATSLEADQTEFSS
ncbi:hypothetical protein H5V45_08040 [Nocardioides sp. KIGAM211]|uniref:Glycosyltransferase RgtA/B/C/D-like domain-containing protein n=1 Tax=Nocardioides luti TaxID=2761101 RepID=A0A7X0VAE8_9ACTN|nr:hypothetical protein [Nocardioides luti]MBB6627270.1 hypothetical protein [Nocardioides luti]